MEKLISSITAIQEINRRYTLSTDALAKMKTEITNARVCIPIIGRFSSGKSALVNALLGGQGILKEDITPETAIPTEIIYSPNGHYVDIMQANGNVSHLDVREYCSYEASANTVHCARIGLNNPFLSTIPDVMIVDMPGFESGYEIHDRAIDSYIHNSLAYIITFPADDMNLRESLGNILKELCLHDMPICIVITKYDKANYEFEKSFQSLKMSLKKYVGERELSYCITSRTDGNIEELKQYLQGIQLQAKAILRKKFSRKLLGEINNTEAYLSSSIKGLSFSFSELDEQEDKLKVQMERMQQDFAVECEEFTSEIPGCVSEIVVDVQSALEAEINKLVTLAKSHQDLNGAVNATVRRTISKGVKTHFVPLVERYLERVARSFNSLDTGDIHIDFEFTPQDNSKSFIAEILALIGGIFIPDPRIKIIITAIILLIQKFGKKNPDEEIRQKLEGETIPEIIAQVESSLQDSLTEECEKVVASIRQKFDERKEVLQKSLDDLRAKMTEEQEMKDAQKQAMQDDLNTLEAIKNGM